MLAFFPVSEELVEKLIPEYAIDVDNGDFGYKKENTGARIDMNNVYANVPVTATKRKPAPRLTHRKNGTNAKPNVSLKSNVKKIWPRFMKRILPKTRTKPIYNSKTKKNILGTAFG